MNATKILRTLQTALCFTIAICDVILILLFGDWEAEVAAAKQRLGAKAIAPNGEPETQPAPALEMIAIAQTIEPEATEPETITPTEIQPQPETIPNPWELPVESTPAPQPLQPATTQTYLTLCLPPAKETDPQPAKKPRTAKTAKTAKKVTTTKATKAKTAKKAA